MLVGHDVAGGIDDEIPSRGFAAFAEFRADGSIIAEKLRGEIFKRIANLSPNDSLGVDIDDGGQDLGDRQHGGFGGGIGLRKKVVEMVTNDRKQRPVRDA